MHVAVFNQSIYCYMAARRLDYTVRQTTENIIHAVNCLKNSNKNKFANKRVFESALPACVRAGVQWLLLRLGDVLLCCK